MVDISYECEDCEAESHNLCRDIHCGCCQGIPPAVDELRDACWYDDEYDRAGA